MSKIWVLTQEYNDYDQHGDYLICAWDHKPTSQELLSEGITEPEIDHVLHGGGRINHEYSWYNLYTI